MTIETGFLLNLSFLDKLFNTSETVDPESDSARISCLLEGDVISVGIISSRLFADDDDTPHFTEKLAYWKLLA